MTSKDYYDLKTLSFSTVRQFAQNPQRALDAWHGIEPWFTDDSALLYGSYVHAQIQDALELREDHAHLKALAENEPALFKKDGNLYAKYYQAEIVADTIVSSDIVKWVQDKATHPDRFELHIEEGLLGKIEGTDFKGKPDVFLVDKVKKTVIVLDFKTSKPYSATGQDWITTIDGQRIYDNIAWDNSKLFAWQGAVYIELLKQNGYSDYKFVSRYIVATKQDVPRLDVWTMTPASLKDGLDYVKTYTRSAVKYLSGEITAPAIADGSAWFNRRTHGSGNKLTVGGANHE
jgi:hypothetical protein